MPLTIRKVITLVEEIYSEGAADLARPLRVAAGIAVVKNPFAGRFEKDLTLLSTEYSGALGPRLTDLAVKALGNKVQSFGKAALVGEAGEVQHGSAIIHTRLFGDALRNAAHGIAPVTAAEKRGVLGGSIDVSFRGVDENGELDNTDVSRLFSWEIRVPDAPKADEILVISAVADGGRPDPRQGR